MVSIEPVASAADLRDFIRLPRRIYAGLPGFSPPLDMESGTALDPERGAFFTHGEARYWLARRDGVPVGRIAAMADYAAGRTQPGIGSFGCLDAVDDAGIVAALVGAARAWLSGQGYGTVRGPFQLSINGESGLLVDGHTEPPMVLMPWHPPYLQALVLAAGLAPAKDLLTYRFDAASFAAGERARDIGRRVARTGLSIRPFRPDDLDAEADIVCRLFNEAWADNWGFVPMQKAELRIVLASLRPFLTPDHALFAEIDGEPVSFVFVLQNLSELARGLGGRLLPFNWIRLLWRLRFHAYGSARIVLMGTGRTTRGGVLGGLLPLYLLHALLERRHAHPIRSIEAGWVLEDNHSVRGLIEAQGGVLCRRHRIFEADLPVV